MGKTCLITNTVFCFQKGYLRGFLKGASSNVCGTVSASPIHTEPGRRSFYAKGPVGAHSSDSLVSIPRTVCCPGSTFLLWALPKRVREWVSLSPTEVPWEGRGDITAGDTLSVVGRVSLEQVGSDQRPPLHDPPIQNPFVRDSLYIEGTNPKSDICRLSIQ